MPRLLRRVAVHGMGVLRELVGAIVVANWPGRDAPAGADTPAVDATHDAAERHPN